MVRRAIVALVVLLVPALAEARGGRGVAPLERAEPGKRSERRRGTTRRGLARGSDRRGGRARSAAAVVRRRADRRRLLRAELIRRHGSIVAERLQSRR